MTICDYPVHINLCDLQGHSRVIHHIMLCSSVVKGVAQNLQGGFFDGHPKMGGSPTIHTCGFATKSSRRVMSAKQNKRYPRFPNFGETFLEVVVQYSLGLVGFLPIGFFCTGGTPLHIKETQNLLWSMEAPQNLRGDFKG